MFTTKFFSYEERIIQLINQLLLNNVVYRQLSFKYNINLYIKIKKLYLNSFSYTLISPLSVSFLFFASLSCFFNLVIV